MRNFFRIMKMLNWIGVMILPWDLKKKKVNLIKMYRIVISFKEINLDNEISKDQFI